MPVKDISTLSPKEYIIIKGAAVHNLKKVDVAIPRNKMVVITGLSGSGKSSLAFDTLYAEGQRRYVESLSSYARQFMVRMEKPEVDYILGISPAIAIEQKVNSRNPRSTVGTTTEIYDYLKLLFARIGKTISPISGQEVKEHSAEDVYQYIVNLKDQSTFLICCPVQYHEDVSALLESLQVKGFSRVQFRNRILRITEAIDEIKSNAPKFNKQKVGLEPLLLIIDRLSKDDKELNDEESEFKSRCYDSISTAFAEGNGSCIIQTDANEQMEFSNRFELDGMDFQIPDVNFFSFNNPIGACKRCEGFGTIIGIDPDLVVPDKSLSVYESAIVCWRGEKMSEWKDQFLKHAYKFDFPIHKPFYELTEFHKELLWKGNEFFRGLDDFFKHLEEQSYKIQYRVMLSRYRGKTLCPECKGSRLRSDASYVKIDQHSITDLVLMQAKHCLEFFKHINLNEREEKIAGRILYEIKNRLQFLNDVGLGYLTLNRLSNTLSGGESQRINLATSLGTTLVGSMYILDEPSIGLHPRDTQRLIEVLRALNRAGNTVIVVEHDEDIMKSADELIDIGPEAGYHGGTIVYQGTYEHLLNSENDSYTLKYLSGRVEIAIPKKRRKVAKQISFKGCRENNLKNIDVNIPLNMLCVVTGVSGSGKTSLVKRIVYPAIKKLKEGYIESSGMYDQMAGEYQDISSVEMVDQNPIGSSSRSNPVTYVKAFDEIRNLFADLPFAKKSGFKASHFSFNVSGGRCEACQGDGYVTIEMQFMADLHLKCEVCDGKRFRPEVLAIKYKEKSIDEVLNFTVEEALDFFNDQTLSKNQSYHKKITARLQPLKDVGLGYIKLGQSANTLSGGEAQRVKLALFLSKGSDAGNRLFIFDEPSTGLHFHDIKKLLKSLNMLINNGNSVLVIEHHPDIIKSADWVIDLGPEGGDEGGEVVFEGTPEDLVKCERSYTGKHLIEKLPGS
ncbi:MAG TPA: excinuclease ABC subunit UvrA [Bacteroidia bacterium]|nr:excinuclease ABC subunit UvrA [Bacteroidia bacterium]HNT80554.1 excinuclease ABC subunit UvrA [Bacteroidia bacterium]